MGQHRLISKRQFRRVNADSLIRFNTNAPHDGCVAASASRAGRVHLALRAAEPARRTLSDCGAVTAWRLFGFLARDLICVALIPVYLRQSVS